MRGLLVLAVDPQRFYHGHRPSGSAGTHGCRAGRFMLPMSPIRPIWQDCTWDRVRSTSLAATLSRTLQWKAAVPAYLRVFAISVSCRFCRRQTRFFIIRRFIACYGKGLSGKSLARMLSAWRSFYNYLIRDHGHAQPLRGAVRQRLPKMLPRTLSRRAASCWNSQLMMTSWFCAITPCLIFAILPVYGLRSSRA